MKTRLTVAASLLLAVAHTAQAGTAAGTTISNTATATYVDSGLVARTATSNTVITTVQQVAAVTLATGSNKTAAANTTVSFLHTLTNTGNGNDTFNLTEANTGAFAMADVKFYIDTDGNGTRGAQITGPVSVAAGASYKFIAVATMPSSAATGTTNTMVVTATSTFTNTVKATSTDTTTVGAGSALDITANSSANGAPGTGPGAEASAVITNTTAPAVATRFVLFLNNNGGSADTFNLQSSTDNNSFASGTLSNGWTVVFRDASSGAVITSSTIAANSSMQVWADVTPTAGATAGTSDIYFRALSPTSSVKDSIHDAITIDPNAMQVTLVKTQALDAACDGTADTPFSIAPITTGALPGACIRYSITATNNGVSNVNYVQIKDDIPANTTYFAGTNPGAVTLGTILTILTGNVNNLTTSPVTLTPGQSSSLSFGVRINP
jgi:hypothetical protein